MGVDLLGRHGDLSFNWDGWRGCLAVAVAFGWKPTSTVMPSPRKSNVLDDTDRKNWGGSYFTNDQEVTDVDASALSLALHRALAALATGQTLTEEQANTLEGMTGGYALRALADYSAIGGFAIG